MATEESRPAPLTDPPPQGYVLQPDGTRTHIEDAAAADAAASFMAMWRVTMKTGDHRVVEEALRDLLRRHRGPRYDATDKADADAQRLWKETAIGVRTDGRRQIALAQVFRDLREARAGAERARGLVDRWARFVNGTIRDGVLVVLADVEGHDGTDPLTAVEGTLLQEACSRASATLDDLQTCIDSAAVNGPPEVES